MLKTTTKKSTLKEKKVEEKKEVLEIIGSSPTGEEIKIMPVTSVLEIEDDDDFSLEEFKIESDLASKPDRYFEAIGRRKTAVARVRLFTRGAQSFLVNGKPYQEYFTLEEDQQIAISSMKKMKCFDKFKISIIVKGGGHHAQAEAVRHGTARVLVDFNNNFKKRLRKAGYLTRDPRMKERKKFGLKRARKAPQWSKR